MATQVLKQYIDKVLGNSIRCLLPSYWWKRLFHQVADRIDEVEKKVDDIVIPTLTSASSVFFIAPLTEGGELSAESKSKNAASYRKVVNGFAKNEFYDVKIHCVFVVIDADVISNPVFTDSVLKLMYKYNSTTIILSVSADGSATIEDDGTSTIDTEMSDTSTNAVQNKVITAALNNKVDKVEGKQLSTEDFTTTLKNKLEGLSNYDDTELSEAVETITNTIIENEEITAAALNDLNNRLNNIVVTLYLPSEETQTEEEKLKNKSAYDIYLASLDNPPVVRLYNGLQYLNVAMYGYDSELGMLVGIIHKADVIKQSVYTIQSDGTISPLESE